MTFDDLMLRMMWTRAHVDSITPTWRGGPGPRVLIEEPDPAMAWADERVLSREGYDVAVCGGPSSMLGGCPLLEHGSCRIADEAAAIVVGLSMSRGPGRALVAAHRERRRSDSICVETLTSEMERFGDDFTGTHVLRVPVTRNMLLEGARRAAHGSRAPEVKQV